MKIESFSIKGKHYSNEDSLRIHQLAPNKVIAVLADGMGGLSFGKETSDLIVNALTEFICGNHECLITQDLFGRALEYADKLIAQKSKETHSKMGAAVALIFIDGYSVHYTWLGNVRIYLAEQGEVKQLTIDHSLDAGYGKQLLTRCIKGNGLRVDWPYQSIEVKTGTTLVLCTDGLYKQVKLEQMFTTMLPIHNSYDDDASMIRIEI